MVQNINVFLDTFIFLKTNLLKRMKNTFPYLKLKMALSILFIGASVVLFAQGSRQGMRSKSDFWQKVQFGGGIGLSMGSGYTNITLAPSAIYNFNPYVAFGLGAQYGYIKQQNNYTSNLYGGSAIALFNPVEKIQLSIEYEQLRVNANWISPVGYSRDFWNTGLFLGGGYRAGGVTIGARYNVLFNKNNAVYSQAFMPFLRVYF